MVEDGQVDSFPGASQPTRRLAIGSAGPGITARMVVSQDDGNAAQSRGINDDLPDRHANRLWLAVITFDMQAACALVDMRDP